MHLFSSLSSQARVVADVLSTPGLSILVPILLIFAMLALLGIGKPLKHDNEPADIDTLLAEAIGCMPEEGSRQGLNPAAVASRQDAKETNGSEVFRWLGHRVNVG